MKGMIWTCEEDLSARSSVRPQFRRSKWLWFGWLSRGDPDNELLAEPGSEGLDVMNAPCDGHIGGPPQCL